MIFKSRKKLTEKEAGEMIENTTQMLYTLLECVHYWQTQPRSKSDILIEALCGLTREQMISENLERIKYCESKIEYAKQFAPKYKIKGSYGYM